jgi:LmbE family N-acetylglucosaminyl deacetylase
MACRVTINAFERTSTAKKLYLAVRSESAAARLERAREALEAEGRGATPGARRRRRGVPDGEITTFIDTAEFATRKQQALDAHTSQLEGSHWLSYSEATIRELFAQETFIRLYDATGAPLPETDLFAGLRQL